MLFLYLCNLSDDERNLVEVIFKENQTGLSTLFLFNFSYMILMKFGYYK